MAIYLGLTRVSPTLTKTVEKVITITNTQDLQGNIISTSLTETQNISGGATVEDPDNLSADLPVVTEWTRPNDWPDLDALPTLTEGVYLTYDNRNTVECKWACFYCDVLSSGLITIALGHMNGNNFVLDATWNVNTATYKEIDYSSAAYNYVIFKITPTTATKHMTSMYFGRIALATIGTLALRPLNHLYCLERKGWLPYLVSTAGSGDNIRYCTQWMLHDNVEFGNTVTSLSAAWYRARSLKKIEFGNWTGENCNINNISAAFQQCRLIEKIDLTQWNTANWHVTSIASLFLDCYNLKICIVPFNTINWGNGTGKTFNMHLTWCNCMALAQLDLSMWDMSNLNVTTIYLCWYQCYSLKSLNVKTWNTTKWTINSTYGLYYVWGGCRTLVDIDLSGWNTSNWTPNRADYMFYNNNRRRNFNDIKNWDTSKWLIAQFNDAFNGCTKILELDLRNWNTSTWKVTTLSATFGNMHSVRTIDLTGWNTSNWKVTNIHYTFYYDYNLEEIKGFWNWNVSGWPITNGLYLMFYCCHRLKEINFANWTTTAWNFGADGKCDIRYFAGNDWSLKKINLSTFNIDAINSLTYYSLNAAGSRSYSPFYYCFSLEELTLPQNYKGHIDLSEAYKLPRSEFIKTFNALSSSPIGTTAKVWIVNTKYKLTTADIAIATNKGYTVVQS